jgi:hypothetical protein
LWLGGPNRNSEELSYERIKSVRVASVFAVVFVLAGVSLASNPYVEGFVWDRTADWVPGTIEGSTAGNPCVDAAGNPVWHYQSFRNVPDGAGLGSPNPWYKTQTIVPLVWDWDSYGDRWSISAGNPWPCVADGWMNHHACDYENLLYSDVPLVTWANPAADPIRVSIKSKPGQSPAEFFVGWRGFQPPITDVDVAVVHHDVSTSTYNLLYGVTVPKPTDNHSVETVVLDPLEIDDLLIEPGDEILITARAADDPYGPGFITFADGVEITVVPEPMTLGLLALGGLVVIRRRRKS